jgi:hypothetical protein
MSQIIDAVKTTGRTIFAPVLWVLDHAIFPAAEKVIPQGSAEIAQALFTGNGFVPYGPTNMPVSMISEEEKSVTLDQMRADAGPDLGQERSMDRGREH